MYILTEDAKHVQTAEDRAPQSREFADVCKHALSLLSSQRTYQRKTRHRLADKERTPRTI